jgi:hypothetical protein
VVAPQVRRGFFAEMVCARYYPLMVDIAGSGPLHCDQRSVATSALVREQWAAMVYTSGSLPEPFLCGDEGPAREAGGLNATKLQLRADAVAGLVRRCVDDGSREILLQNLMETIVEFVLSVDAVVPFFSLCF